MGVIVVEELVVIIGIGQFKWHSLEEHVNLINRQNTVVQFHVVSPDTAPVISATFSTHSGSSGSTSVTVVAIGLLQSKSSGSIGFWFFQFRNHSYILDEII